MSFIPIFLIFIPIIFSLIIYLFQNKYVNYLVFFSQIALIILSIQYYFFLEEHALTHSFIIGGWNQQVGIELANNIYTMIFIFLSIFIWTIIILYSFDKRINDSKFLFFLLFLEGAFLALIQSNDLFNLFILIEITTIIATILIIYKKDGYAVRAGIYYLLFNSVGIIFFLLGTILIYYNFGTLNINLITNHIHNLEETNLSITFSYILFIASIGVKSALFPVFTWLPKAHGAAPSSVSALLSGLIVKMGIFIFIRIQDMFSLTSFNNYFFIIGFLSALIGIIFALSQKDIKQILAYHTISQIGIIFMGLSYHKTFYGGIFHLINHALFKSLLFLCVGIIIRNYNVRRVTEIRGVFKTLPFTSLFLIIGMFSITGAPLFNGYISKSLINKEYEVLSLEYALLFVINIGTATSFIKLSQIFFGKSNIKAKVKINESISIGLLALACILLGTFYNKFSMYFFSVDLANLTIQIISFITYFITIIIGFIIYKKIVEKDILILKRIRHLMISFETINYLLVLFFFSLIIWSFIFV